MAIRIRYRKTQNPNIVQSTKNFAGQKGALYRVRINTKERTYRIVNVRSQKVIRSTEKDGCKAPKNLYTVYEQVKRALATVGVQFDHEFRGIA